MLIRLPRLFESISRHLPAVDRSARRRIGTLKRLGRSTPALSERLEERALLSGVNVQADFLAFNANGPIVEIDCITGDTNNDGTVNDRTPTFEGEVTIQRNPNIGNPANLLVVRVQILEGADVRAQTTFSSIFGGSFPADDGSYPLTQSFSLTTSDLGTGTQNLTLRIDNGLIASRIDTTDFSINIDTSAPAAPNTPDLQAGSDLGISSTDNITSDVSPSFTINGVETGTRVELLRNGSVVATNANAGSTSITLTDPSAPNGTFSYTARQTDDAENVSPVSGSLSVTIDGAAPAAPSTPDLQAGSDTGASSTDNITSDTSPSFDIASTENGATVELLRNGSVVASGTGNGGTLTLTDPSVTSGTFNYTSRQRDVAGNQSATSGSLSVTIDATPPASPGAPDLLAGSDSGISNTDNITNVTAPTFAASGIETGVTVELLRNGSVVDTIASAATTTVNLTDPAAPEGTHNYSVRQTDAGGLTATGGTLQVQIDVTAPGAPQTPDLQAGSDSGRFNDDNITRLSSLIFGLAGLESGATAELLRDAAVIASLDSVTASESLTDTGVPEGTRSYTARQRDVAGNTSAESSGLTVTVDMTSPAAPSRPGLATSSDTSAAHSSDDDDITSDRTPAFDVSGVELSASVTLFRDGSSTVTVDPDVGTAVTTITDVGTVLPVGSRTITVDESQVVPRTGDTATATATFTLMPTGLQYSIQLNGLDLKADSADRTEDKDVTHVHLHSGAAGTNGDHVLNIFGIPSEDDDDLVVDFDNEILTGFWDDSDATDLNGDMDTNDASESKPFSDFISQLLAGTIYLQIHTVESPSPGAIRGQVNIGYGTHDFQLTQTDLAGNTSAMSSSFEPVIDSTIPTITNASLSGTDNAFADSVLTYDITTDTSPTITFDLIEQQFGLLDNPVQLEIVQINSDSTETLLQSSTQTFSAGGSDLSSSLSFELDASAIAPGLTTIEVRATDAAGNLASSQIQVFALTPGADTPSAPGTPIFTDFFDLSGVLDPTDELARNQVWQMSFDKTTQTVWINTELGTQTFQFDPATGQTRVFDLTALDPDTPAGTNPHGVFFDFDAFLTPRVWIAHRNAGGSGASIAGDVDGARLSYYDLVANELVTFPFEDAELGVDVNDLHAVFVDDAGTVWAAGTHSNTLFEIQMNRLDPTDRQATVIPHILPDELAAGFDEDFVPHGVDVVVDERTGEAYVWLIAEGGTGRVALLRPRFHEDGRDAWVTWDVDDAFEGARGTFVKIDDGETPGIPDDDTIVGTFPVERPAISSGGSGGGSGGGHGSRNPGGSPASLVGVLQVLSPGSVMLDPTDLTTPGSLRVFELPAIPGSTGTLAAVNQPFVDREGTVYYADRTGGIARLSPDEMTPTLSESVPQARVIVTSSFPSAAVTLDAAVFDAGPLFREGTVEARHPALVAYDTDGNGELSMSEAIAGNPALIALDANSDQIISADELSQREDDRSSVDGLDQYEVAGARDPAISGQGRGLFRGTINASNVLYGSIAQNDALSTSVFAETARRQVSAISTEGGGRMVFQVLRNGSLVMTSRPDGALFDEQINLTREIVLQGGIDPESAAFDAIAFSGDPSAIREDDGTVRVFGKNASNNIIEYRFSSDTGVWTTHEHTAPVGTVLAGEPTAFMDGDRGAAAVVTASNGHLILFRPDGSTLDLTALATDVDAARVYASVGVVDDEAGGRIYLYGADMSGAVIEYRFNRTGDIASSFAAETLVISDGVRVGTQTARDVRILQSVEAVLADGARHVFGTDGTSRLVHLTVDGDANVTLAENVTQLIADTTSDNTVDASGANVDTNGDDRVSGYFPFQMPYVARVYTELAPLVNPDGSLAVYGTNGGDLVLLHQVNGMWEGANLSKDIDPTTPDEFTPANFVFGAPDAYIAANGDRHIVQINKSGEIVEFTFDASEVQFSTQNINLARGNSVSDLQSVAAPPAPMAGGVDETIIDNGDVGYSLFGTSDSLTTDGFDGDFEILGGSAGPRNGSSIAAWDFTGLEAGNYRVSATWSPGSNNATDAVYVVITGGATASQTRINQQRTPGDFTASGEFWQDLNTSVAVTDGTLRVLLGDEASGRSIADAIRIERILTMGSSVTPLRAEGGVAAVPVIGADLQPEDLAPIFDQARAIWTTTASLDASQIEVLDAIVPAIADLSGDVLGGNSDSRIFLDTDAAGYGWFVDSTPGGSGEFGQQIARNELRAGGTSAAAGRIDLLTVVLHEMGHALGYADLESADFPHALMSEELGTGTRRLPVPGTLTVDVDGSVSPVTLSITDGDLVVTQSGQQIDRVTLAGVSRLLISGSEQDDFIRTDFRSPGSVELEALIIDGNDGDDRFEVVGINAALAPSIQLNGNDGDDRIVSLAGLEYFTGGAGRDVLRLRGNHVVVSDTSFDSIPDIEQRLDGVEIKASARNSVLDARGLSRLPVTLRGSGGPDTLYGGSQNDAIYGMAGDDVIDAGAGNDKVMAGSGDDSVQGGDGNDSLQGNSGDDVIDAGAGNDRVTGHAGRDQLRGGTGDDTVNGGAHNDTIVGDSGDDIIRGGAGNDLISGSDGNDNLNGSRGSDTVLGGDGRDVLRGGAQVDLLIGGNGRDRILGQGSSMDTLVGGNADGIDESDDDRFDRASEVDNAFAIDTAILDRLNF